MTNESNDKTPELNIEDVAEAIVREESSKVDFDGEDCPKGDECAVHHRNDEEYLEDDVEFGRIITYVGDYCVITSDNPELDNPLTLIRLALGLFAPDNVPDAYETSVLYVGEGALADLRSLDLDGQRASIRFVQRHNQWKNFKEAHNVVVNGVRDGLIDVSSPAFKDGE